MNAVRDPLLPYLRPMNQDDVLQVFAIESEVYPYPWTESIFRDCLQMGYCSWVFERQGGVVAYGLMSTGAGEAHILNLCVHPQHQGQGLGRRMLQHLLQLAARHQAQTVFLEVRPSNHVAFTLYHSLGFNEIGTRRAYYPAKNGREDALILAKELAPGGWSG